MKEKFDEYETIIELLQINKNITNDKIFNNIKGVKTLLILNISTLSILFFLIIFGIKKFLQYLDNIDVEHTILFWGLLYFILIFSICLYGIWKYKEFLGSDSFILYINLSYSIMYFISLFIYFCISLRCNNIINLINEDKISFFRITPQILSLMSPFISPPQNSIQAENIYIYKNEPSYDKNDNKKGGEFSNGDASKNITINFSNNFMNNNSDSDTDSPKTPIKRNKTKENLSENVDSTIKLKTKIENKKCNISNNNNLKNCEKKHQNYEDSLMSDSDCEKVKNPFEDL